jgi:hypothetical protein
MMRERGRWWRQTRDGQLIFGRGEEGRGLSEAVFDERAFAHINVLPSPHSLFLGSDDWRGSQQRSEQMTNLFDDPEPSLLSVCFRAIVLRRNYARGKRREGRRRADCTRVICGVIN